MEYSLDPAFMVIDYHTAQSQHKMTLPTLEWLVTDITGTLGSYQAWDLTSIDAEVMITNLVDELKDFCLPTTTFDAATVYTQASPTDPAIPRKSITLDIDGVSVSTGIAPAISTTFNFKTLANGNSRLVLLDTPLGASGFQPIFPSGFTGDVNGVINEWTGVGNAWAGRDNTRPSVLRTITFDLNDRLQKAYFKT